MADDGSAEEILFSVHVCEGVDDGRHTVVAVEEHLCREPGVGDRDGVIEGVELPYLFEASDIMEQSHEIGYVDVCAFQIGIALTRGFGDVRAEVCDT